ncbi:alpha/beta hydrolase [Sphaerospermopsis kisseleviana]|nr:alpha/beta hydrolase [Sphaerospermopsis kisseleviana]
MGRWGDREVNNPITNYQLPITNYQLPITHYPLPITNVQILFSTPSYL